MVTAGKVFKLVEPMEQPDLASKLEGYRREEAYEEGDYRFTLVAETMNSYVEAVRDLVLYSGFKDPESMLLIYRMRLMELLKQMNRWAGQI